MNITTKFNVGDKVTVNFPDTSRNFSEVIRSVKIKIDGDCMTVEYGVLIGTLQNERFYSEDILTKYVAPAKTFTVTLDEEMYNHLLGVTGKCTTAGWDKFVDICGYPRENTYRDFVFDFYKLLRSAEVE